MREPCSEPGGRAGFVIVIAMAALLAAPMTHAGEVARGDLTIVGLGLEVQRDPVITAVDVPSYVQTFFAGATAGLSAQAELTGPGIDAPITLSAVPGQKFAIPALRQKGDYALQNIRLAGPGGEFLQQAVPSVATIQVTDILQTKVKVRQLTPAELRERGIFIDERNYEVYEYTFVFGVDGQTVEIPYPVIIDKRTREITPLPAARFAMLPFPTSQKPPRFSPPTIETFDLSYGGPGPQGDQKDIAPKPGAPTLPAALVVPNGFGVLHQFFAVILQVSNGAPDGSNIRLDSITAKLASPTTLRVSKVMPAVAIGQPVPVVDEQTGTTFLVAGAQGSAEWTLEALKAGTHTIDIDVRATYQKAGQEDFGLSGRVSTSLVVSDPRFHVNFSHPDVVRKDDPYTAYSFITNLSNQQQHVDLDLSDIPACTSGGSANNVCRADGTDHVQLDLAPGAMVPVAHKLIARVTGKVYAAAGAASDEHVGVSVHLTMGVSQSGIPLSPATLVMPYYAQFLPTELVDAQMQLLGLGYSLATAPLTQLTASKPRVITTDVFRRAQQIALAGQRIFTIRQTRDSGTSDENRDAFLHLSLDLLGNVERVDQFEGTPELSEWDELRRTEEAGRIGAAALSRQLETIAPSPQQFVDDFAAATSHRTPFFFAYVHGPPVAGNARPYAMSLQGLASLGTMNVPAEAAGGWIRALPYGELTKFNAGGDEGELAMVGRWSEGLRISVVPAATSFTLHLLYPDASDGSTLRSDVAITGAQVGVPVTIDVQRGSHTLIVKNATGTPLVDAVPQTPLRVLGASQDLNLDGGGHIVGLLFNRPITIADGTRLRDLLSLTINVTKASYTATRRNNVADPGAELQIPAAALQEDGRIVLITFDKTLSKNATYVLGIENIAGLNTTVVPRVDNDRPAAILTGKVLRGDNTPVPNVLVRLRMINARVTSFDGGFPELIQYDVAGADGRFLFEYVPRDIDRGLFGEYDLIAESEGKQATLTGSVRLPGEVHTANLVFLGRGKAIGQVRWDDGSPIANANVSAGSPAFGGTYSATTGSDGRYEIEELPVGPLVFSTVDPDGRIVYATNAIRTAGEVITQDLVAVRAGPAPGFATVRVQVLRSDTLAPVSGALAGVGNEHVQLQTATTDAQGRAEFHDVPAGLISILAAEFSISRNGAAVEVELHRDQVLDQTLVLQVADPSMKYASLEGVVTRDDPTAPGDGTKDAPVANGVISIYGVPAITTDADGSYVYPDLPLAFSDHWVQVFDPQTSRHGWFHVPTLVEGVNHFPMRLSTVSSGGKATMRVRVTGGRGEPVAGALVFSPGYPPTHYENKGGGLYDLANVSVPMADEVLAVMDDAAGPYGEQFVKGTARVDFDGQIGVTDLRLPGVGTIVAKIEIEQPCSTPPCYAQAIGLVAMTYSVWDDFQQKVMPKTVIHDPDPVTNLVTFDKVPARQEVLLETVRHPAGYDVQKVMLSFDGDLRNVSLRLKTTGDVTGRVLAHDGITPVAGATVRIETGTATYGAATTKQDGSFVFAGIAANIEFNAIAELNQDGVFRTGFVTARTPEGGGPVGNLVIVMREQATVEGRVLDNATSAPVPLAHYWLRELAWPYRAIGTATDPLTADINGRFIVSNVFTGPFRVTAVAPDNQELRGDYQGTLADEGDVGQRDIQVRIGGAGVGSVSITVVDPVLGFEPVPNAEVALLRNGGRFDLTTTNDAGLAFFDQVPVGTQYSVFAYSKQRGRSGSSTTFTVNSGETASASVQLDFLGVISGTLTDPDGDPANVPVPAQPVTYTGPIGLRATTDATGNFEFNGVPEGPFTLQAWQLETQRVADGPPGLFISKLVPEQRNLHLELERMGTLTVKVYLPNDTGGPGELAPLAEVTATQCTICNQLTPDYPYFRGAQGNPLVFPRMFRRVGYSLEVRELGGEARTVHTGGGFAAGELAHEQIVVLPQSGSLEATVLDGSNQPVADAEVLISGTRAFTVFTAADGRVSLHNLPFGWYTVQAKKNNVSAAAGGDLHSRSQPLQLTLNLGTNISVAGHVDAEEGLGLPSPGTRVIVDVSTPLLPSTLELQTLTDANGDYAFTGIPVGGTAVSVRCFGPDDTTVGAKFSALIQDGATGTVSLRSVKLDATPPRVLAIDPPANATNVSPSSPITVTFSEEIDARFLHSGMFELTATDDDTRVDSGVTGSVRPDLTYVVTVLPPLPPAGQTFRLKSNVLYRLAISDQIEDATGHRLRTAVGSSFTTVNYTEPAIVKVDPAETDAVPEQATFRVKFNKAVDAGTGTITLQQLDSYKGLPIATLPVSHFLDSADPTTIVIAPSGVAIAESSFYRLSVSGVQDMQTPPNVQRDPRVFEFFSFDRKRPEVTIVSPVGAGEKLTSGVLYTAGVSIKNEGTADDANDIAYVDWLDAGGVSIARVKAKPFAYDFVAPNTVSGTTFTLQATATDLSGNTSGHPATFTWDVVANAAPTEITVTHDVPSVYPSGKVETRVHFQDEGLAATVALELRGTALDGAELHQLLGSQNITRPSTSVAFPEAVFHWTAPLGLKDGSARVIAIVTDSVNNAGSNEAPITVLLDQTAPVLVSFLPKAENRYKFGVDGTYTIELQVKDAETGIARAVFTVAGATVFDATGGTLDPLTGITTFRKDVSVPPKNADTRVPVIVTAYDQRGNLVTETHEVIYERVDDATLPRAAWVTPLDGAALPSNVSGWQTTLRVQATDDVLVTSVRFESSALAAPIELTSPKNGTTDIYETQATLTFPAAPFVITAIINDGDPAHEVELPITIDPVAVTPVITGDINITNLTAGQYANKSVLARGNVRVYVTVPLALQDLILVDGATVSVSEETKLDLDVSDHLFVDADSKIDVTAKGFLGGLRTREDNSFTNASRAGRTPSGPGAINADGSHAGLGGSHFGATNATYGSIETPSDFGSGGGAHPTASLFGGNGGGAMALHGGRFVLAGVVRADGDAMYTGGAGGSVLLDAHAVITGPLTRITANGGDGAESADQDRGGGGGRIAIRTRDRLDLDATLPIVQARGGRNGSSNGAEFVDGGAGTIVINDALLVSSIDEHAHRSAGTPLAGALAFDSIHIGPRALARFDVPIPANVTADATAMILAPGDVPSLTLVSTTPLAGANVPQFTALAPTVNATSASGIREVRTILSVQPNDVVTYPHWTASLPDTQTTIVIPDTAPVGPATLQVRVTDRAGRIAESAPVTFNIVANTAPVIDTFTTTPDAETYAGHDILVNAAATDDVAITSLTLASSAGTVTPQAPSTPTPQSMTRQFTVSLPPATPSNTSLTLTLSAADGFPGRAATTSAHTIAVRKDTIPPAASIVAPLANQQFNEGSGATFTVDVTASDAEVAVQHVTATLDGVDTELAFAAGHWTQALNVPNVEGADPVAKTLTIKAYDYDGNVATEEVAFFVKPLIDPNAPALQWSCASPGAMFPPGYEIALRVNAVPTSPSNGVSRVELSFANGAPLLATRIGTTDTYEVQYTIPAGTTDGTAIDVRVSALSVGGNESTLLGTLTAVTGVAVNTTSTIAASDPGFENQSVIVNDGAVLTVVGPHHLRNVVVLSGGKLIQQSVDPLVADAFRVERMFIACGGLVDVSGAGLAANVAYAGTAAPTASSGASHVGRGTLYYRNAGGAYGSVFEPKEPGSGGHMPSPAAGQGTGGGMVRIHATGSIALDGAIRANGLTSGNGAGAGGSVWITTGAALAGSGTIEATGANGGFGGGGGGAIALEYASTSDTLALDARGGKSSADSSRNAAAGSVFRRAGNANGDLVIDNKGVAIATTSATELPAFGRALVAGVAGNTVTLNERRAVSNALVGHRLRAYADDGSVRGTFRIASIANSAVALAQWATINTSDSANYDGWLLYTPTPLAGRNYVAVRRNGGQWEYDNDSTLVTFTPAAGQLLFASFTKAGNRFTALDPIHCDAACTTFAGIQTAEVVAGYIVPDTTPTSEGLSNFDAGEILLRGDAQGRAFTIAVATPSLTLEKTGGANVQSGDRLRGLYLFDNITLTGARVVSEDLVESVQPLVKDAPSSLTSNASAPAIDLAKITIERASAGLVIVGAPGAIADPNAPLEVVARNGNLALPDPPVMRGDDFTAYGSAGGFSVLHVDNVRATGSTGTLRRITSEGYLAFSPSQSNTDVQVSLSPNDTTAAYEEPGHNSFRLKSNGTYETWANGANVNVNGTYSASTAFRIEKSGSALRWYVDNVLVHAIANAPASLVFDVSFAQAASGEIGSVELGTSLPPAAFHASVASDGSFRVPAAGIAGDPIRLSARDRHPYSLASDELTVGVIPSAAGIAAVTFDAPSVIGGRIATGTITLLAPAGPDGALVALRSNDAVASVPPAIVIAPNATSAQFHVITTSVASPIDAAISGTWITTAGATLTVTPPTNALASLTLDATAVDAGTSVNATVTLGADAPAGGSTVMLASSDPTRATVPTSIVIPAGSSSAAFTITTLRTGTTADVTISATWGTTLDATLTVTSCTPLDIAAPATTSPSTIWFDDSAPYGATTAGAAIFDATQAASGTESLHFASDPSARTWSFSGAPALTVGPNDRLELYALIDPCDPPRQIALTWSGSATLRATWGEALIARGTQKQIAALPDGGVWTLLSVPAQSLGVTSTTTLTGLAIDVYGGEAWFDLGGTTACSLATAAQPARNPNEAVWFDDVLPAGAAVSGDATFDVTQAASGTQSIRFAPGTGTRVWTLSGASTRMSVGLGDLLYTYVLIDPCNPPREISLEFNNGSDWNRGAYWGEDLLGGATPTELSWRSNMGPIPAADGEWVRLEVPAALLKSDLASLSGVRVSLVDGGAWFDVFGTIRRVNLARTGIATQSSNLDTAIASRGIDGDLVTMAHTDRQSQPWWQVDLGASLPIDTVSIWNRLDCCQDRVQNFWLFVSDVPFTSGTVAGTRAQRGVRAFHHVPIAGRPGVIAVNRNARYVRVQLESGNEYLNLAEVQVWAPASATPENFAAGSAATSQASDFDGATSERAVDGRTRGYYDDDRAESHTNNTAQSWWEVDLGSVQPISRVDLFNQTPCCSNDRQRDFYVFVSDVPFTSKLIPDTIAQPGVSTFYYGTPMVVGNTFPIHRTGRYVRVQLSATNYLVLAEVQIWSQNDRLFAFGRPVGGAASR